MQMFFEQPDQSEDKMTFAQSSFKSAERAYTKLQTVSAKKLSCVFLSSASSIRSQRIASMAFMSMTSVNAVA